MSSPAAAASGGNGDAGQAQQGDAQQGEGQGPDVRALAQTLEGLSTGQEQMREFLMSQPWSQQAEDGGEQAGEPEPANLDLSFLDDAGYDQQTASQLADVIERQMQQREAALKQEFQRELGNVTERVSERERLEQMRDLVDEFPDMASSEVATPVVQQAHSLVEANGWPEQLAADPRFWRLTYAAQQAFAAAEDEGSEEPGAAHLEGGAGASGAMAAQRGDDVRQMLDDQRNTGRHSALPFP